MSRIRADLRLLARWLGAAILLAIGGCDTHVDPFVPTDEHVFSIFGVLNPAADTQFVRVEALADTVRVGSAPDLDAIVTLEHLASVRVITLQDSFMRMGAGEVYVHNFWTAEPVEPGASYRLTVERSDGIASWATTTVPEAPPEIEHDDDFVLPCEGGRSANNSFTVTFSDAEKIAAFDVIYPIEDEWYRSDHFDDFFFQLSEWVGIVDYRQDLEPLSPDRFTQVCAHPPYALIAVAAGGPDWPDFMPSNSLDELARPDTFTNVVNGHGLFGGVYSDTVRIEAQPREPLEEIP